MLTYREWRVYWSEGDRAPVLYSKFVGFRWSSDRVRADRVPELPAAGQVGGLHGIHSVRGDASNRRFLTWPGEPGPRLLAIGAVDASGVVREHADGIVRSEEARVLALRLVYVPYPAAPCEHQGTLLVVGRQIAEGDRALVPCMCFLGGAGVGPPAGAYRDMTVEEVEDRLLRWYEVPRFPEPCGPWPPPWGVRPWS